MPHTTIVRPAFGDHMKKIMGDLSYMQASYKTGVSAEYLRMMVNGRVPSEGALVKVANGLNADLYDLRVAAGYEQESDPVKAAGQVLFRDMPHLEGKAKDMVQAEMEKELERLREKYAKKFKDPE